MKSPRRRTLTCLAAAAFAVAGCGDQRPAPARVRAASLPKPPPPAPSPYPAPETAFDLLPARVRSFWSVRHGAELVAPMAGGFALFVTDEESPACNACAASVSVAYFRKAESGWRFDRLWTRVLSGRHGRYVGIRTIDLGRPDPAVIVEGAETGMDARLGFMSLVELTPRGPAVRIPLAPLDGLDTAFETDPARHFETYADVEPLKNGEGLKIVYEGLGHHAEPIDATVVYRSVGPRWRADPAPFARGWEDAWADLAQEDPTRAVRGPGHP